MGYRGRRPLVPWGERVSLEFQFVNLFAIIFVIRRCESQESPVVVQSAPVVGIFAVFSSTVIPACVEALEAIFVGCGILVSAGLRICCFACHGGHCWFGRYARFGEESDMHCSVVVVFAIFVC